MSRRSIKNRLLVEALEDRQLMASSLMASLTSGVLYIEGTDGDDVIKVTQTSTQIKVDGLPATYTPSAVQKIRIFGLGGNDSINLSVSGKVVNKATEVFGGGDNDTILGGSGADYLDGGTGADYIEGRAGNDFLAGDSGNDHLSAGDGNDKIMGGSGNDFLHGGAGADLLDGGSGDDALQGSTGTDTIYDDATGGTVTDSSFTRHFGHHYHAFADMNLSDAIMRRYVRLAMADTNVTRDEMMTVLRKAGNDGVSDAEFTDLMFFTASNEPIMPTHVRMLAKKVVYNDPANLWWTGGASERQELGFLQGGSTQLHMNRLIDKWFLGADRPMAKSYDKTVDYTYQLTAGSLFVNGVTQNDVNQGNLGDCYFLAGLAATAKQTPSIITNMFLDNGDGTWTVKLYKNNGNVDYVTVDKYLPVNSAGKLVFAETGSLATSSSNELWVALAEKAYAQMNESNAIGQDGTNSYNGIGDETDASNGINGGSCSWGLIAATGATTTFHSQITTVSSSTLQNAMTTGRKVAFGTPGTPPNSDVVGNHCYALVGYNSTTGKFKLYNPWGAGASKPDFVELTVSQIMQNFSNWAITTV